MPGPAYLAYVVSFLTIGTAWLADTALTDRLARSDPIFWRSEGSRAGILAAFST